MELRLGRSGPGVLETVRFYSTLWLVGPGGGLIGDAGSIHSNGPDLCRTAPRYTHLEFRSTTLAFLPNGPGPSAPGAGFLDDITRTRHPAGIAVSAV